jgi:imidazolonepropionase-like amidohydrolase
MKFLLYDHIKKQTKKYRFTLLVICLSGALLFHGNIEAQSIAIINAKLYTSANAEPVNKATILINDGIIKAVGNNKSVKIPAGYQTLDVHDKVVTPGFWNNHVHFIELKWENADVQPRDSLEKFLQQMLTSKGFVYAFDLAELDFKNVNDLRKRITAGEITGPTILSVGVPYTSRSPFYIRPAVLPEIKSSAQAKEHIQRQLKDGANGIKIWSASPTRPGIDYMSDSLIQTAAKITSQHHIPLFAHPTDNRGVLMAVENGVNVLAHTSPDDKESWDTTLVNLMIRKKVSLIPTLKLFPWELKRMGIDPSAHPLLTTAIGQLSVFFRSGGTVLFGTDVGYMADYDPSDEYSLMAEAGMSFRDILASLTINPASVFGYKNTGKIQPGMDADIVVLNQDPAADVRNFSNVAYTLHKGRIIYKDAKGK